MPWPIVVAFSGGGDSLALVRAAKAWADGAGRRLIAVTIDHGIRPEGAAWAAWCQARAAALGVAFVSVRWEGEKPANGLAAAAREARHRLIAGIAREADARVILMGHTADDGLEAAVMREHGARVSAPRIWSPSPVWPGGRGLFILRPLLGLRRAAIRACLSEVGESWIEDPANVDPAQPRARARAAIDGGGQPPAPLAALDLTALLTAAEVGLAGDLAIARPAFAGAAAPARRAFLAAALACVAGTDQAPRGRSVRTLADRIVDGDDFVATLTGARLSSAGATIRIVRESRQRGGAASAPVDLPPGRCVAWDGRFELRAHADGLSARPLAGVARRLPMMERRELRRLDPAGRRAAPAVTGADGRVTCPILAGDPRVAVRCLVGDRLAGACGAIPDEATLCRVAKTAAAS